MHDEYPKNIDEPVWFGIFKDLLLHKAEEVGTTIVFVDPKYAGEKVKKTLAVRVHEYKHCGLKSDRDVNAARNILAVSLISQGEEQK